MRALLLALGIGIATAQPWPEAQLVVVHLIDDRFVPDKVAFKAGALYRLRLENDGKEMHEFTAPEFFKSVELKNPQVLEQGLPEILLQPGDRKDLYFIAHAPGRYRLTCADHDWDGMIGEIAVE